ncbi:hypothetical protein LHYA1_G004226 [Lachnellula hyalina]|uniref:Uncharacterized protein n=1 Tax=Lachnellula hyalina TaxID=1316788 RepID=A0A8H8TZ13_9HELO|nr:uncharacterized protein LHYA1_G004226 [Lachnellula hyalina]TVY27237.1 hypothetical protein LHYA1_G004226 [Lachnellula hyalina]
MSTNPAIAGTILRNFSIITAVALTGVYASDRIISIASRKQMGIRGEQSIYNASVHPEQDPLDTILDRKNLMNAAKARKPWNMTLAEKERSRRGEAVEH